MINHYIISWILPVSPLDPPQQQPATSATNVPVGFRARTCDCLASSPPSIQTAMESRISLDKRLVRGMIPFFGLNSGGMSSFPLTKSIIFPGDKTPWDESLPGFRVGSTWRWHSRGRLGVLINPHHLGNG